MLRTTLCLTAALLIPTGARAQEEHAVPTPEHTLHFAGGDGPGAGHSIVLVSGDEEYRSEEALPQLARILAERHGFECTVLFAIDPETGEINPDNQRNIPGLEALDDADLMIIATRFRNLPDEQMAHIDAFVRAGRPVIGLRTATHAFALGEDSAYASYSWNSPSGGFGREILGETWVAHHGHHGHESTRGLVADGAEKHPIARGLADTPPWGPTDVYAVRLPLPEGCTPIILGQSLGGMTPDAEPVEGPKNNPMMPVAWTRTFPAGTGKPERVFTTTMGAATDLSAAGTRTMLVNAVYWALGMESSIPAGGADARLVGDYEPTPFGFGGFKRGVRPRDLAAEAGGE